MKKYSILISTLLLFLSIDLVGSHTIWTGVAFDYNWFNSANWDNGVPMIGDSATISTDSVIINNATDIKQLFLVNGARLVITPNGALSLDNGTRGIECTDSRIYNYGNIVISTTLYRGIELLGASLLDNYPGASVTISHSISNGAFYIDSNSEINIRKNSFFISLQNAVNSTNTGSLRNRGTLRIMESQTFGLDNFGTIINRGMIEIDSTISEGIINNGGKIENYDTIKIARFGVSAILNQGTLTNYNTGQIDISNSSRISFLYGINNDLTGTVINDGSISIKQVSGEGIVNNSDFFNRKNIFIEDIGSVGLLNKKFFSNSDNASISIVNGVENAGGITNLNDGYLLNEGLINVSNVKTHGIYNSAYIYNLDTIDITGIEGWAIANVDSLDNFISGCIHIHDLDSKNKIGVFNTGVLKNEGEIKVMNVPKIGLFNSGSLINIDRFNVQFANIAIENSSTIMNTGTLQLEDVDSVIINNGNLINSDSIIVQGICDAGISNNGKIENQTGASIISTTDVPIGIDNKDSLQNNGFIYIDLADKGIQNTGYILNQDSISLSNNRIGIDNREEISAIVNDGGINIAASEEHSILIKGSVDNNGTITVYQLIEVISGGILNNNMDAMLSIFWGRGSEIDYLLIQYGGALNGFPVIQALEGGL